MKRFKEEIILFQGRYHFVVKVDEAIRFQCEKLKLKRSPGMCCNLCSEVHHCYGKCPADTSVLIKMEYFKYYKKWKSNQIVI